MKSCKSELLELPTHIANGYQWAVVTGRMESDGTQPVGHGFGSRRPDQLMFGQRHSLGTFRILDG